MLNLARATFAGKVVRNPESMATKNGTSFVRLFIETVSTYNGQEQKSYYEVTAWGDKQRDVISSVSEGMQIVAECYINSRTFQRQDGSRGLSTEFRLASFSTDAEPYEPQPQILDGFNTGKPIEITSEDLPF